MGLDIVEELIGLGEEHIAQRSVLVRSLGKEEFGEHVETAYALSSGPLVGGVDEDLVEREVSQHVVAANILAVKVFEVLVGALVNLLLEKP